MERTQKIIDGLTALNDAMHENQCYACSHEFIEKANEFGTEILADAIALLKGQPQIVRCKDCIHWDDHTEECSNSDSVCFRNGWCKPDWFCADGEKSKSM